MKVLYFDCFSGISGDMILGALLDLGADAQYLKQELGKLELGGYRLEISRKQNHGIFGTDVTVVLAETDGKCVHGHEGHHHHGHMHGGPDVLEHTPGQEAAELHTAADLPHQNRSGHVHRNLRDILDLIEQSGLSPQVKELSSRIFTRLAHAEAKVHDRPVQEVHFHEVGAVDSIVDIVGCAICLSQLSYDAVYCTPLSEGRGFVNCQHGLIPVPVPAVMGVLEQTGIPLEITGNDGEMVTPTGAAVLSEIASGVLGAQKLRLEKTGYGMGKREFSHPNLLRVSLGELAGREQVSDGTYEDEAVLLETNLDDTTGEVLGFAMERLFEAGVKDVWFTPIFMKKMRPAYQISVLCAPEQEQAVRRILLRETGAIGLRRRVCPRICLRREETVQETPYGTLHVKRSFFDGYEKQKAEYEDAAKLARETDTPLHEVLREAGGKDE